MSPTENEKQPQISSRSAGKTVTEKYADITLHLIEQHGHEFGPLTPEKEKKLRRKLYWHLMILISAITLMLFVDKSSLGYAAILGIFEETGISDAQYNNLNTMFYVGKFVSTILFLWAVIIFLHCVATRYAGLIVVRIALGAVEAVIVPAMEITMGMFFNRREHSFLQPIFFLNAEAAPIVAGFVAYGLLFTEGKTAVLPWKLFMIVTGGVTFFMSVWAWFAYPNNPADARFLSLEEKVHVIRRVHESMQSSIEQKHFKKSQFIETLRDPVSWLFALQAFTLMYSNNLTYGQQNLLTTSLGVSNLGSTLVAVAGGCFGVTVCIVATIALRRFPTNLALHALIWCIPAIAGGIGMVTIDWDNKLALLACMLLAGHTYVVTYIIALGWTTSSAAGFTKKMTRNVMFMLGYSVGNLVSPQIWVPSAAPRYYGAWVSMIVVAWAGTPAILSLIRFILVRRNRERLAWIAELSEEERENPSGVVEEVDESGRVVKRKVEIAMLDLTDLENKFFIYPL